LIPSSLAIRRCDQRRSSGWFNGISGARP
jgi:hypothetical protein